MHDDVPAVRPLSELRGEPPVRDEVDVVYACLADLVEDPVDHRPPAHRQQLLGEAVGERAKPGGVAGRQDEGFQVPSSQEAR